MRSAAEAKVVDRAARAAAFIWQRRRERWQPLPPDLMPRDLDEAYAVQAGVRMLYADVRGRIAGWKLALTSQVMQTLMNVERPLIGAVFEATIYRGPARIRAADFVHLGIECELAFRIARDLPASGVPYTREIVARCIASAAPAFELVDDRGAVDYIKCGALQMTAENTWNAGLVLGPEISNWQQIDLSRLRGSMRFAGMPDSSGWGRDILGHPLDALTWIANELPKRGAHLKAGDWVSTGSMVPTKHIASGQDAQFSIERLGTVSITVT